MNVQGFSMTELLLYIAIMTLILGFTTSALVYDYVRSREALQSLHEVCMFSTASDAWAHDMYQALDRKEAWYQPDEHTLIVRSRNNDVAWYIQQETLVRVSGIYNRHAHEWVKKTVNVMATGVTDAFFTCMHDADNAQRVSLVHGEIVGIKSRVTRSVALRNGKRV